MFGVFRGKKEKITKSVPLSLKASAVADLSSTALAKEEGYGGTRWPTSSPIF